MTRTTFLVTTTLALSSAVLRATCPTPLETDPPGAWSDSLYVSYSFNVGDSGQFPALDWSTLGSAQSSDIPTAIYDWNNANIGQNTSGVQFYEVPLGSGALRFFAYLITFPGLPGVDPGAAGAMQPYLLYINGHRTDIIVEANIVFYFNSYNGYTLLSLNAPYYDAFMTKVTLHEIGHSMGLGDQNTFAPAQQSVMNPQNLTNDAGNNMGTNVTSCDNESLPIH